MAVTVGTGAILTFAGISEELLSISIDGIEAPIIDVTHMGSTPLREFTAGDLVDPGSLTATTHSVAATDFDALVGTNGALTVTGIGTSWAWVDAICQSASADVPLEEVMTTTWVFKLNGALTAT